MKAACEIRGRIWGRISGKIVEDEVSLGQGNSSESNSTWFYDRLTEGYKRSFQAEAATGALSKKHSRDRLKLERSSHGSIHCWRGYSWREIAWNWFTRARAARQKLIRLPPSTGLRMRLIFLPGCVHSQRASQRLVRYHKKIVHWRWFF